MKKNTFATMAGIMIWACTTLVLPSDAQTEAFTRDGMRVILHPDGTWVRAEVADRSSLQYSDDKVIVSNLAIEIKPTGFRGSGNLGMEIKFDLTVSTQTELIFPRTHRVYGFENGSDIGGRMTVGFSVTDSLGNELEVLNVSPSYVRFRETGLRPNETMPFTVYTSNYPLDAAESVILTIQRDVFQSQRDIRIEIPTSDIVH